MEGEILLEYKKVLLFAKKKYIQSIMEKKFILLNSTSFWKWKAPLMRIEGGYDGNEFIKNHSL